MKSSSLVIQSKNIDLFPLSEEAQNKFHDLVCNPDRWPQYPFLAVKRYAHDSRKKVPVEEFGTLFSDGHKVYYSVLLAPIATVVRREKEGTVVDIQQAPYHSWQELIDDGWRP